MPFLDFTDMFLTLDTMKYEIECHLGILSSAILMALLYHDCIAARSPSSMVDPTLHGISDQRSLKQECIPIPMMPVRA